MIRVLQVIDSMNVGGMESMLMNYYTHLDKDKIQFDFLIFTKNRCFFEDKITKMGGKIYKITPRRKNFIKNRQELKKFFKDNNYEIIEIHQGITYTLPLKEARKSMAKHIIIHNHGVDRKYKKGIYNLYRKYYILPLIRKKATDFFACSKSVLPDLFDEKIIKKHKYTIINNAIDMQIYVDNTNIREKIRNELGIDDSKRVVGHVGNFTYPKNQEFIIEIAKKMPDSLFVLVGTGDKFPQIKKIAPKNVLLYGYTNKVYEIMQAFDIFILPSRWEGLPLVAVEAQSIGIPVILSDKITKEVQIAKNVKNISLDVNKWVDTIKSVRTVRCSDDVQRLKEEGYDIEKEAKKLENIYEGMVI